MRNARKGKLRGILQLMRFRTTLGAPYAAICGWNSIDSLTVHHIADIAISTIASFTAIAFSQAYNDIRDRHLDMRRKKTRPIPAQVISLSTARAVAIILGTISTSVSVFSGLLPAILSTLSVGTGLLYSIKLKSTVLWGNLAVATTCASMYLYGPSVTLEANWRTVAGFFLIFFLIFGSEILKTGEDSQEDKLEQISTIATVRGSRACAVVFTWSAVGLVATSTTTAISLSGGLAFILIGALPMCLFAAISCITLWSRPTLDDAAISAANNQWRQGWRLSFLGLVLI